MRIVPPTDLGNYKILSSIGSGGMGEVFLAEDKVLERRVAIKCLPEKFSRDVETLRRFKQEAKTISALNHPNILTIHEIGEENDVHFMATEFVNGKTLRDLLLSEHLPLEKTIKIVIQVIEALTAAHKKGIIHRDIKPENVMIRKDGYVKILDFGIAKFTQKKLPGSETENEEQNVKTETGMIIGTFSYMSPEQANGEKTDSRSDIFSFGILLYEMLTGSLPFKGETALEKLISIVHKEPENLEKLVENIPVNLQNICYKCLKKSPAKRFQKGEQLLVKLKEVRNQLKSSGENKIELKQTLDDLPREEIPNLEENEILLTDFINLTGDEVFDKTLKLALSITLEQSPSIKILEEKRVKNSLKLMGKEKETTINAELGREVCQREGIKAFITGTIANLGEVYMLTLEAFNAKTGEPFGRHLEQAVSKEKVLESLGLAATGIRKKLGESLSQIKKFDVPLEKVTTKSLPALKYFSLGKEAFYSLNFLEAINLFKKAVELDPNFASAYTSIASSYNNLGKPQKGAEFARQAYELRHHVSEFEKLRISSSYFSSFTGEKEKAQEILKLAVKTYPRHITPRINLCNNLVVTGQFEKALVEAEEAFKLEPKNLMVIGNLISTLMFLSRYSEAKNIYEKAVPQNVGIESQGQSLLFEIAYVEGDKEKIREILDQKKGEPDEHVALNWLAEINAIQGQIERSVDYAQRSVKLAKINGAKEYAGKYLAEKAFRSAIWNFGRKSVEEKVQVILKEATKAITLENNRPTRIKSALALALIGKKEEAGKIGNDLVEEFPLDTLINKLWIPTIKAAFYLTRGWFEKALGELEKTKRYERTARCIPPYLRGLAYLETGQKDLAEIEFERIINNRGEASLSHIYPLAQLGLARANGKKESYESFLEMWKYADEDAFFLKKAKEDLKDFKD